VATSRDHFIPSWPFPVGAPSSPGLYLQPFPRYWSLSISGSRPWPFRSRYHCTKTAKIFWVILDGTAVLVECYHLIVLTMGFKVVSFYSSLLRS